MTTAGARLQALAGTSGTAGALLLMIGAGATAGSALVDYSGLATGTAAQHLLADNARTAKVGGDDVPRHTGWNKAAWKKKQKREEAITETIESTYRKLIGVEPAPVVVAELKAEIRKTPEIAQIDYTQEMRLIEWLSAQIDQVRQRHLDELDDEEAILLLL